jgi:hypothetical protein
MHVISSDRRERRTPVGPVRGSNPVTFFKNKLSTHLSQPSP